MTSHPAQVRLAAVFGALAVVLGAFGAHGLKTVLAANATLDVWQTASHYHLIHAAVLLALGLAGASRLGWNAMLAGTTIFSGTLYVLAVTGVKWLGAITPIGGVFMIAGWLLVAARK
jgi:uncharacterized membrane protein YgdD (TMEM256/DUF423 family)